MSWNGETSNKKQFMKFELFWKNRNKNTWQVFGFWNENTLMEQYKIKEHIAGI